jgi:histone-lysine N-methyltransferase SETMAR
MGSPLVFIEPRQGRVEVSQDLLQVLLLAKHHACTYIVTLDEAWFYFPNHFDWIWLPHDKRPPSFPKKTIANQKLMIIVVWNPHGFHVRQFLPKGIKRTGRYYSDDILSQIAALRDVGSHRKMIFHADNAGRHVTESVPEYMDHNSLKRAPHPPYSPGLALSDFLSIWICQALITGK